MSASSQMISKAIEIEPRDISFDMTKERVPKYWFGGDPWSTHWMNALFAVVPVGERYICKSFRERLDKIHDPSVRKATLGLIKQERLHAREHAVMNVALLEEHGVPVDQAEAMLDRSLELIRTYLSDDLQCAFAAVSEHFTAVLSEVMFEHLELWDDSEIDVISMMYWHFVEETEHKSVAFDVLMDQAGVGASTYAKRVATAGISLALFLPLIHGTWLYFVWKDGQITNLRSALRTAKRLIFNPGIVRKMFITKTLPYLKPGFHPWDIDNRASISAWKKTYDETGDPRKAFEALRDWHARNGLYSGKYKQPQLEKAA